MAYRNSSIPEVVGDAGLLIDERQPGQLLEAIRALLESDDLAGELRAKGLKQAKRFRWEDTARKTLAVYREVCARKGRKPNRRG